MTFRTPDVLVLSLSGTYSMRDHWSQFFYLVHALWSLSMPLPVLLPIKVLIYSLWFQISAFAGGIVFQIVFVELNSGFAFQFAFDLKWKSKVLKEYLRFPCTMLSNFVSDIFT